MSGLQTILNKYSPDPYPISTKYLSFYRILFCSAFIWFVGLPTYTWLGSVSEYLYRPPEVSLALLYNGFPSTVFLGVLTVVNIVLFVMMFFGIWCKWSSVLFSFTTILGHTYWYSLGHIDHFVLWMITPALLGLAGWGDYFSIQKQPDPGFDTKSRDENTSIYIQLLALFIGFSMFTSGLQKIGGEWWHWSYEGARYNFVSKAFEFDTRGPLVDEVLHIKSSLIWKAMDYGTLIMEIGFLFAVWKRKVFNYFVVVGLIFHIMVLLLFNIRFFANVIVYLVFIDWKAVDKSLGLSKLLTNRLLYKKFMTAVYSVSSLLFLYWIWGLFNTPNELRNKSIFEIVLEKFTSLEKPYESSVDLMFIWAGGILVYLTYLHFGQRNNKKGELAG
ncbi:MAG: hypothetical protein EOP47_15210 [Sphingobacteriaceae bacterium]|nr:MAG: hypothetical protein EOP47_15210 [Sphingobacteriaceae bacterium]